MSRRKAQVSLMGGTLRRARFVKESYRAKIRWYDLWEETPDGDYLWEKLPWERARVEVTALELIKASEIKEKL